MTRNRTARFWKNYRFPIILLIAIGTGSLAGMVLGEDAEVLKPLGDIFLNAMFTVVVPLVFFSIAGAVSSISSLKRLRSVMGSLVVVFILTGMIAAVLMLVTVRIFPPAQGVTLALKAPESLQPLSTADQIVSAITVSDFSDILSRRHMLPLILFSILFGASVNVLGERGRRLAEILGLAADAMLKLVSMIMYYAPIGLGAYFAALIGDFGPNLLGSYARSMVVYHVSVLLYFFIAFTLYSWFAGGRKCIGIFWRNIISPAVTALATQSSVAALPVNFEAASRIGVPRDISEVVLPIGATAHMEGSCFSGILKIAFLFGIFNMPFSGAGTLSSAVLVSVLSGVVLSGVPGGGLVGEMLIVSLYGFPPEAFPIIAMLGFLVDPVATMINASGDTVSAMMIARIVEGRRWMKRSVS